MGLIYDELSNVPTNNDVIPESCLSFYEQAMYVVDFVQNESKMFVFNLGVNELNEYEETEDLHKYVNEGAEILEEAAKDKAIKMFGAMKKGFENLNLFFANKLKAIKKMVESITAEDLNNCADSLGTTHEFFDFTKIKFASNAEKFAKKVDTAFKKPMSREEAIELNKKFGATAFKDVTGIDASDMKDFRNKLKAELIGKEIKADKAFVKKNFNKMKAVLVGDNIPSAIKSYYNDQKRGLDNIYTLCYSHDGEKEYNDSFILWEDALTSAVLIAFVGYNIAFDVYKRMHAEYAAILYKVAKTSKKAVKEAVVPDQEDKDLVKEADPKEQIVPDSVVEEGVKEEIDNLNMKKAKAESDKNKADVDSAKAAAKKDAIDTKIAAKKESIKECEDAAARAGEVEGPEAEESEGKPVPEVEPSEVGDGIKTESYSAEYTLVKSLFDF